MFCQTSRSWDKKNKKIIKVQVLFWKFPLILYQNKKLSFLGGDLGRLSVGVLAHLSYTTFYLVFSYDRYWLASPSAKSQSSHSSQLAVALSSVMCSWTLLLLFTFFCPNSVLIKINRLCWNSFLHFRAWFEKASSFTLCLFDNCRRFSVVPFLYYHPFQINMNTTAQVFVPMDKSGQRYRSVPPYYHYY